VRELLEMADTAATVRPSATPVGVVVPMPNAGGMTDSPVLTKGEAAGLLRVSVRSLERAIAAGALPAVRLAGGTRIRRVDLDAYVTSLAGSRPFRDAVSTKATNATTTSAVGADIVSARDGGGFTAVAASGDLDRDNERIMPGCFAPLPATVPVHLDHRMSAASVIGRGRPYMVGDKLRIDANFASTKDAQDVRQKVADGVIDSMSIVFRGLDWKDIDGIRTCVKGELLAADLVSVPSNSGARILSSRSMSHPVITRAYQVAHDAQQHLYRTQVAEARALMKTLDPTPTVTVSATS
jgi:HK97 family phage prohead protease